MHMGYHQKIAVFVPLDPHFNAEAIKGFQLSFDSGQFGGDAVIECHSYHLA